MAPASTTGVLEVHDLRKALFTGLALIVICATLAYLSGRTPAPVPETAPPTTFSVDRAMKHVRAIAQRPHPSGSTEHARVREYLVTTLRALGLEPQIQETTGVGTHNTVAARVSNVLARVPGRSAGGPAVLLVGHYDGVPVAPAAGDDGAAVAALLETLRALRAAPPLAHDVIALFSDGEEAGLTGAAAFVREHPWAHNVAVVLNFEGRGTRGPSMMFETGAGDLDAVQILRRVPGSVGNSLSTTVYRRLTPNDSDLSELFVLGQPALNFGFADGLERYHTPEDDVAHLDAGSVQHHGQQALALARAFGDGPLPRPRIGDAIFFTLPGLGIVLYPERFAMPLAIAASALVLAGCMRLRRRQPRWMRDVSLGVTGTVVTTVLGAATAFGVSTALERVLGRAPTVGSSLARGLYSSAIAMVALSVAAACWTMVRRWASTAGAQTGALLVWALVMMIVTWALPGASFLFVWPLLAATAAAIVALSIEDMRAVRLIGWAATVAAAAVLVPIVHVMAVVISDMGVAGATLIGFVVPFSAWLLAPQLDALTARRRWAAPVAALAAALVLVVAGVTIAERDPTRLQPSILAYALDADTSNAWLTTLVRLDFHPARPEFAARGSWGAAALGPSARLVVPRAQTEPGAPQEWLTRAIAGESRTMAAAARPLAVGAPDLKIISDQSADGARRLELRVLPAPGTYSIRLRAIDGVVLSAAVDGRAIDTSRYRTPSPQWTLGYVTPSSDGFDLALRVPNGRPLALEVIARSLGLPEAVQAAIPTRPQGIVPIASGDQTVVHRRFRF